MNDKEQLVLAACAGNQQAMVELLKVCQPDLKRFARRTCDNAEDAEDAVQVALWQMYRKLGALRAVATLTTWMFRIVERECFRLFRKRHPDEQLDIADAESQLPARLLPQDLQMDLISTISELPAIYREVLILRDVYEQTAPEVAAELGLTLEAVKSRLHRVRMQIRQRLLSSGYREKDDC